MAMKSEVNEVKALPLDCDGSGGFFHEFFQSGNVKCDCENEATMIK